MNKKLTYTALSAAIATVLSANVMAAAEDVVITELVDPGGTGNYVDRAFEISNLHATDSFTFPANRWLKMEKNSDNGKWTDVIELSGQTIPAGKSLVILNSAARDDLKNKATANAGAALVLTDSDVGQYTGDDRVAIVDTTSGNTVLDIIGTLGVKENFGQDSRVRRRNNIPQRVTVNNPDFWERDFESYSTAMYDDVGLANLADAYVPPPLCSTSSYDEKSIEDVQGDGFHSPLVDTANDVYESEDYYEVTGVVTQKSTSLTGGFYIQQTNGIDPKKSKGIFVKTNAASQAVVGNTVCIVGKVAEQFGMTTLLPKDNKWEVTDAGTTKPTPVDLVRTENEGNFRNTLERHEGMLVNLPTDLDPFEDGNQEMRVSRTFSFDYSSYRNNMVLAYKRPNMQPNHEHVAGSAESKAAASQNNDYRVYVDTDEKPANGVIPFYKKMETSPQSNYILVNDGVSNFHGVLHYSYNNFRLVVNNEDQPNAVFNHNTGRSSTPTISSDAGDGKFAVKLATQNVLNFFNSPYGGSKNLQSDDNRGAKSQEEFEAQRDKIVEALYALDADVVGLMEIENNGFANEGAIANLVNALNSKYYKENPGEVDEAKSTSNRYVFVGIDSNGDTILDEKDHIGGDAITTGVIYRPKKVKLLNSEIIEMPRQVAPPITDENGNIIYNSKGEVVESGSNYQRNTIVAKFQIFGTGKTFNVAVNHFKSKGSTCWEDWAGWKEWEDFDPAKDKVKDPDFQGNCENFRVAAAKHLGEQMARIGGDRIIVGDLNAYGKEDPLLVLTENTTNKELKTSAYTLVGSVPMTGSTGGVVTNSFGYVSAVEKIDAKKNKASWSYSYNDEIGSLDHILLSGGMSGRIIDATDWHVNSIESSLYDYSKSYKGSGNFTDTDTPYRSSDHDPAIVTLAYDHYEAGDEDVTVPVINGITRITYVVPAKAELAVGDVATISVSPMPADTTQLSLPTVTVTDADAKTLDFNINGLARGTYTFTMKVTRPVAATAATSSNAVDVANSEVEVLVTTTKPDSVDEPKTTAPSYDGTGGGGGGSVGILSMLGLFGLGLSRRKRRS